MAILSSMTGPNNRISTNSNAGKSKIRTSIYDITPKKSLSIQPDKSFQDLKYTDVKNYSKMHLQEIKWEEILQAIVSFSKKEC